MTSFEQLPTSQKTDRLRALGEVALEQYGIVPTLLEPISTSWNTVFRIETTDAKSYVLRVSLPFYTEDDARGEIAWMRAVGRETAINVPRAIETRNGDVMTRVKTPDVPEPRVCLLFSFVKGTSIQQPTPEDCIAWGEITAILHAHATTWTPTISFNRPTFRSILPFRKDRLAVFSDEHIDLMGPHLDLFHRAWERAQMAIDKLYNDHSHLPILLHNDLHPWNLLRDGTTYTVIDFEDIMWGYPVQDAGVSLFYMLNRPDFTEILDHYRQGYTRHLPWFERSEGELDTMMIVRDLHLFNVSLQTGLPERIERLTSYLPYIGTRLNTWLETGKVS